MRKFLLYSSALVLGLSGAAEAACIQTPTCSSLGYTSTSSCTGGTKCPFGNAWNCTVAELNDKITEQTNKITEITNKITTLEEKIVTSDNGTIRHYCLVGDILFSDKSCSSDIISGKTPIGVVFFVDAKKRLAIALEREAKEWSSSYIDIPSLPNEELESSALLDLDGKSNTATILTYGKEKNISFPAAEYAYSYSTAGTKAGDWYLPALGEINEISQQDDILTGRLEALNKANIIKDSWLSSDMGKYWSSTECSDYEVWEYRHYSDDSYSDSRYPYTKSDTYYVLPVLEF